MAAEGVWGEALKPFAPLANPVDVGPVRFGGGSLALIAGPCAIESEELCLSVGRHLANLCQELHIPYVYALAAVNLVQHK